MNFRGREAAASMTSEVKTNPRFDISGPDYPQISILEAAGAIRIFEAASLLWSSKSKCPEKKNKKNGRTIAPYKTCRLRRR